jgi:NAD(P)-dependent dehydrogenase (short-subunit alcohol dehydrogenase family)
VPAKHALIIGASRGIGAELVRQYLSAGWPVHATVRNLAAPGELADLHGDLTVHELDVRDVAQTELLANTLGGTPLDVVIHNAGIFRGHPRPEMMEVNAVAPIRTAAALLTAGALGSGSKLGLITSQMGARRGSTRSLGDYGDSKAELNDGFRRLAPAWAKQGVVAVVVHPGWVRTDMGGAGADIGVTESATGIRHLMANLTPEQHGRFWTWEGREHPW